MTVKNVSAVSDGTPPEFLSVAMSIDGLTITLTYDEALHSTKGPAAANFAITVQGERRDVSTVTVNGQTVALGLGTAITSEQKVTVTYTDPTADVDDTNAIQDLAGNDAANLSEPVSEYLRGGSTGVAPTFVRAVLSSDGGTITLTYNEVLHDSDTPSTNNFEVTVDGASAAISSVDVRGRTVVLGLDSAVRADQDVVVSYTDPTADVDDTYAIQDPAGNDAADLDRLRGHRMSSAVAGRDGRRNFESVAMSIDRPHDHADLRRGPG